MKLGTPVLYFAPSDPTPNHAIVTELADREGFVHLTYFVKPSRRSPQPTLSRQYVPIVTEAPRPPVFNECCMVEPPPVVRPAAGRPHKLRG